MTAELFLPWPARVLSPNARAHWGVKSKAAKLAREYAHTIALAAGWHRLDWPTQGRLHVWIDGYPPSRRHYDHDNLLGSLKSALDGIADAMRVDDRRFVPHPYIRDEVRKGGQVRIRVSGGPTDQTNTRTDA